MNKKKINMNFCIRLTPKESYRSVTNHLAFVEYEENPCNKNILTPKPYFHSLFAKVTYVTLHDAKFEILKIAVHCYYIVLVS